MRADREKKSLEIIRQVGFFTIIPMVLLAGPIIGFIIGDYLDKRWDTSPWFMLFFILLGCIASIREMIDLIKKAKR